MQITEGIRLTTELDNAITNVVVYFWDRYFKNKPIRPMEYITPYMAYNFEFDNYYVIPLSDIYVALMLDIDREKIISRYESVQKGDKTNLYNYCLQW